MSSSGANLEKYLIPLDEINRATDNFSRERYIGGGGFGGVYRGQLSEGWEHRTVAVKRLSPDSHQGESEFRNEIEVISKYHHENIIAFIGYCDEGGEMIIVYEYASNGSLDDHLLDPNKMRCITWAQRLEICIGAAKGLQCLHSDLRWQDRVIHRDVKSANILLDGNMVAKICDFGLSKLGRNQIDTQPYTKVAGTEFYLDPSYRESGILQKESDVYSFGVVLFEVVSGMLVYRERRIGDDRQSLMNTVRRYHQNEPDKIVDPCIRDQISSRSFETFKEIAYECIRLTLTQRPEFDTVIKKLEEALIIQISGHSATTPADGTVIESIIGKLNSVSPDDQWSAFGEIRLFTEYCPENRVAFGQAGAIPRLTHLLTEPGFRTQEQAIITLFNLSYNEKNKRIIISSGAVPVILHMLEKGSYLARENAAETIYRLSVVDEAEVTIGSLGAIPPLVLLLSKGGPGGKMIAANSLYNLCKDYDNKGRAVTAGLVPILLELVTEAQGAFKEESLKLLSRLSKHPKGKLAIGEAEAVPHLVEVIGHTGCMWGDDYAVAVLVRLCSMDQKYLVEAVEHEVMWKLRYVRKRGTYKLERDARKLLRMISDHQHVDYDSDDSHHSYGYTEAIENMIIGLEPTDSWLVEIAKRGVFQSKLIYLKIITSCSCIR